MKIGADPDLLLFLDDVIGQIDPKLWPQPLRILGNGSNVLIDDVALRGTVLVTRQKKSIEPEIIEVSDKCSRIRCSAGMYLPTLAAWALKNSLSGCEYMVGVPGTVGGAVVQNAGANQQEMKFILHSVDTLNLKTLERKTFTSSECSLVYRSSLFKNLSDQLIVSADLILNSEDPVKIREKMDLNLSYRKASTPYFKASLGSIYTRIPVGDSWLFPGKLIEEAGLKGESVGGASVSEVHANYIVNNGNATFADVLSLMKKIEQRVYEHSGTHLHREIVVWSDR